jgi:hypothetical protein
MNASAKRHILYISLLPTAAAAMADMTITSANLVSTIVWMFGIIGTILAAIGTVGVFQLRQLVSSVKQLADNQSKITVEVEVLKKEREDGKILDAVKWQNQEEKCISKHAHCVICLDRRKDDAYLNA